MREALILGVLGGGLAVAGIAWFLHIRRKRARLHYRRKLELALSDGTLSSEEVAELEQFRAASDLTHAEVRMVARAIYRTALRHALDDAQLTEQEDQALRKLQLQLALSEHDLGDDGRQLARLRLLARVEAHQLPAVDAPVHLVPNEIAHWVVQGSLADRLDLPGRKRPEVKGVTLRVASDAGFSADGPRSALRPNEEILPVDLGILVVTSRRTVFQGAKRTISLPHARLENIVLYADGLHLEETGGAIRGHFLVDDAELTAAIALQAARRRRSEIRPTESDRSA